MIRVSAGVDAHLTEDGNISLYPLALSRKQILPALVNFHPDMIFVSAGFDAHRKEDLNLRFCGVTEHDYEWLTEQIVEVANRWVEQGGEPGWWGEGDGAKGGRVFGYMSKMITWGIQSRAEAAKRCVGEQGCKRPGRLGSRGWLAGV